MQNLKLAGEDFGSRLFLGTGKFSSNELMGGSIVASGTEMVTVALRRVDMHDKDDDMLKHIDHENVQLLPNTSGVRNAKEAVFAAQVARGTRNELVEIGDPSRPEISFTRSY